MRERARWSHRRGRSRLWGGAAPPLGSVSQ